MKTDLFKSTINFLAIQHEVGDEFTTKSLIKAVGHLENTTYWKRANNNPNYCLHMYKSSLRKAGFISQVKRGIWKINLYIPTNSEHEMLTVPLVEFMGGRTWFGSKKYDTLKGRTRQQWKEYYQKLTKIEKQMLSCGVDLDMVHSVDIIPPSISKITNDIAKSMVIQNRERLENFPNPKHTGQTLGSNLNPEILTRPLDGESTQLLLNKLGMEYQMLKQLMMTLSFGAVKSIYEERVEIERSNFDLQIKGLKDEIIALEREKTNIC